MIIWRDDAEIRAVWWCDITVAINIAKQYGVPLAHFLLAKQLESLTSLRRDSVLFDGYAMRRSRYIDFAIAMVVPVIGVLIHIPMMSARFVIVAGVGPITATYWDGWAIFFLGVG